MSYDNNGQYTLDIPLYKNDCVVPWCDGEAHSYGGHPWETHFCTEHFSTIDSHKVLVYKHSDQIRGNIALATVRIFSDAMVSIGLYLEFVWTDPMTNNMYFVFEGGTLVGISSVKEYRPEYIYRDGQKYHPATSKGKNENA